MLDELKDLLNEEGDTEIQFVLGSKGKKLTFKLDKARKFDLSKYNSVKNKGYVKKINF